MAATNSTVVTNQETPHQGRPKNRGSIFSFHQEFKQALGHIETLIQWIPRSLSPYGGGVVNLTTQFRLVSGLRMSGDIPPPPHMLSWCAQRRTSFYPDSVIKSVGG